MTAGSFSSFHSLVVLYLRPLPTVILSFSYLCVLPSGSLPNLALGPVAIVPLSSLPCLIFFSGLPSDYLFTFTFKFSSSLNSKVPFIPFRIPGFYGPLLSVFCYAVAVSSTPHVLDPSHA